MADAVDSLPSRPLKKSEVLSMRDEAREYCIRPESDEAFVIAFLGQKGIHAMGFDDEAEEWILFHSRDMEYSDETFDEFEEEIYNWAESHYGLRLGEDLHMSGPSNSPVEGA